MTISYPAIVQQINSNIFDVSFPDFEGHLICHNLREVSQESSKYVQRKLSDFRNDNIDLPNPTPLNRIKINNKNQMITLDF